MPIWPQWINNTESGSRSQGNQFVTWSLARLSLSRMWEVTIRSVSSRSLGKHSSWKHVTLFISLDVVNHSFLPSIHNLIFLANPSKPRECLAYLVGALADGVNQLLDDHVHTLDARLLQLHNLLLHYGLKSHIWGEKSSSGQRKEQNYLTSTQMAGKRWGFWLYPIHAGWLLDWLIQKLE